MMKMARWTSVPVSGRSVCGIFGCHFVPPFRRSERPVPSAGFGRGRHAYRLLSLGAHRDGSPKQETAASGMGREIARLLSKNGTSLVLHFDVNKTIIMVDPSGGKTQSQVLNSILSEISWGHVELEKGEPGWKWDGGPPSLELPRPPLKEGHSDESPPQRFRPPLTYSDFVHQIFADEAEGDNNALMKGARDNRKGSFTEEGQPGAGLREEYLGLERALALPKEVSSSPLAREAGLAGRSSFYIIPSFFECLRALKEVHADFALVFRTFGGEIAGVASEHNAFCEGKHPLFPGVKMDGTDGQSDYRVHMERLEGVVPHVGAFFRDDEGVALVMGTLDNPNNREQLRAAEEKGYAVFSSVPDIHNAICDALCVRRAPTEDEGPVKRGHVNSAFSRSSGKSNRKCLAMRDFYPYWRSRLEAPEAGKILAVDLSEKPKVWPIMFDDNVGRLGSSAGAHIVDVLDVTSNGGPVRFDVALSRHVVRAEPFLAISPPGGRTPNFFLSRVLDSLAPLSEDRTSNCMQRALEP